MRTGKARLETNVPPVAQVSVATVAAGLDARLRDVLGIPQPVVDLILTTTYNVGQLQIPLFAIARSTVDQNAWVYNNQELQEIVRVYDLMKGAYTATGEETDPVRSPYSSLPSDQTKIVSNEDAYTQFAAHIAELALNKALKIRKQLLVDDDSVFEAPMLAEYRREELLKVTLLGRKRVPVEGTCRRGGCKSKEVYQEELFIRSGDEGGVWFTTCAKCEYRWKA